MSATHTGMKIEIKGGLSKDELGHLLQSIRSCEQAYFRDKELFIWVDCPELTTAEVKGLLTNIKPAFDHGPYIVKRE